LTVLEIAGLNASYGCKRVLHDITLPPIADGEVFGLLGPNASGKSTLMRCLSREKRPTGTIRLDGTDQQRLGHADWHRRVALVPQTPPEPSGLRPIELMWSTARTLNLSLSDQGLIVRIKRIFTRLGLADLALEPLRTLSGGQRQLLGLGLALVRAPDVLLLDEPTSALDLHWRLVVLDHVRERVQAEGGLVVAALHDLDLATRYCDKIALIDRGRVVASGTPAEVLTPRTIADAYRVEASVEKGADGRVSIQVERPIVAGIT